MNFLKKYWPTIAATLGGVIPFLIPSILAYVSAHPHTTVGVLLAAFIAAYHATAPKDQSANNSASSLTTLKAIVFVVLVLGLMVRPASAQTHAARTSSGADQPGEHLRRRDLVQ